MPPEINDDDLKGLSESERAALAADDDTEILNDLADDEDDDTPEDDASSASKEAPSDSNEGNDAPPAKDVQEKAAAAEDADIDEGDEDQPVVMPTLNVESVEGIDEKIKAARQERSELHTKFAEGFISESEYQDALSQVDDKIDDLRSSKSKAEINQGIQEANQKAMQDHLQRTINRFFDGVKSTEGIDYNGNKALFAALDVTVKDIAAANPTKSNTWVLNEAHAQVKKSFGIVSVPKGAAKPDAQKQQVKAPDLSKVPPSIARKPAAAASDDGGEFAHLEKLSGMALEKAVARMSPEQQARWAEAE